MTPAHPLVLAKAAPAKTESVFTFGAPVGMSSTASPGIISGLRNGREFEQPIKTVYDAPGLDADAMWIQTTAPISPDNSGGPLVNSRGEVVGVTAWTCRIENDQKLNFAISTSHLAKLIAAENLQLHPLAELPPTRAEQRVAAAEKQKEQVAHAAVPERGAGG